MALDHWLNETYFSVVGVVQVWVPKVVLAVGALALDRPVVLLRLLLLVLLLVVVRLLLHLLHILALLEGPFGHLVVHILNLAGVHILKLVLVALFAGSYDDALVRIVTATSSFGLPGYGHVLVVLLGNC